MKKMIQFSAFLLIASLLTIACAKRDTPKFGKNNGQNENLVQKTDDTKLLEAAAESVFAASLARYTLRRVPFTTACTPKQEIKEERCIERRSDDGLPLGQSKRIKVTYACKNQVTGSQTFELSEDSTTKAPIVKVREAKLEIYEGKAPKAVTRQQNFSVVVGKDSCVWTQSVLKEGVEYYVEEGHFAKNDSSFKSVSIKKLSVGQPGGTELTAVALFKAASAELEEEDADRKAAPAPKKPTKPVKPNPVTIKNLAFSTAKDVLNWSSDCPHPPTGTLEFSYEDKDDKPKTGSVLVAKENVALPASGDEKIKTLAWSNACGKRPGEVPVAR